MKLFLYISFVLLSIVAYAQPDIVLVGNTERTVQTAVRIAENPVMIDTVIPEPDLDYPLLNLQFQTSTEIASIDPATIRIKDNLPQLYRGYVKMGVGTELMPLGELYYNSTRSRKYVWGGNVKHLSSFGNIPGYVRNTFDRTNTTLFGKINEKKYQLGGNFHYNNQGLHYYALPGPVDTIPDSLTRQRYNDIGFGLDFSSRMRIDTFDIDYKVYADYNHFNSRKPVIDSLSKWRGVENFFQLGVRGDYALNKEIYSVDLSMRFNKYNFGELYDTIGNAYGIERVNAIVSLKPQVQTFLWNNKFKARIGLDFTLDGDGATWPHIYPLADLRYSLFNDIFIPYIGVKGGMKQGSLKALSAVNEFVQSNVIIRNEDEVINLFGGFKGTISKRVSFNVGGSYSRVRDLALFVTDTLHSLGNQFDVIYDTADILTLEGSIGYQLLEKLKVDVIGTYRSYELLNNSYAWHLPAFQFVARAGYNLFDKFLVNLDMNFESGRKALVNGPGENVSIENGQYVRDLQFIYDMNLGLEYRYSTRLSAFVQMNNVASQRYMRWYNAPVHSFQFLGGVTFRF